MEQILEEGKNRVEVCLSPALFEHYHSQKDTTVVVIDVFRATSAICTAFAHGIKEIRPVASLDEAREYQRQGYIGAAERNGEIVDGFELGNSPFSYMKDELKGKPVVLTTTNGTKAISVAKSHAKNLIIGSFLNLSAVTNYLKSNQQHVLLLCAGWKDRFNLEDTLFAGAVVNQLMNSAEFSAYSDSAIAAAQLFKNADSNLEGFLENSSHRNRLARLNLKKDISFCLKMDEYSVLPYLDGDILKCDES